MKIFTNSRLKYPSLLSLPSDDENTSDHTCAKCQSDNQTHPQLKTKQ